MSNNKQGEGRQGRSEMTKAGGKLLPYCNAMTEASALTHSKPRPGSSDQDANKLFNPTKSHNQPGARAAQSIEVDDEYAGGGPPCCSVMNENKLPRRAYEDYNVQKYTLHNTATTTSHCRPNRLVFNSKQRVKRTKQLRRHISQR